MGTNSITHDKVVIKINELTACILNIRKKIYQIISVGYHLRMRLGRNLFLYKSGPAHVL